MEKYFPLIIVLGLLVVCVLGFSFWPRKQKTGHSQHPYPSRDGGEAISPQMGFPVEPGITGWQNRDADHARPASPSDIDDVIRRVEEAPPPFDSELADAVAADIAAEHWGTEIGESTVHRK